MLGHCPRCGHPLSLAPKAWNEPDFRSGRGIGICDNCGAALVFDPSVEGDLRGLSEQEWSRLRTDQRDMYDKLIATSKWVLLKLMERDPELAMDLPFGHSIDSRREKRDHGNHRDRLSEG